MSKIDDEEKAFVTLLNYTGADSLQEVLNTVALEREGMRQLHDENTALKIYNRKLRLVVDFAFQIYELLEGEGGMFLSSKVRDLIGKSRNQIALADRAISESKNLTEIEHKG